MSYTQLYIQLVLPVNFRRNLILPQWENELYKYMSGTLDNRGHKSIAINGMPDHTHIFFGLNPKEGISDLVREIKKTTNAFINNNRFCKEKFEWQEGFGAFSYHQSMVPKIYDYVINQKLHHQQKTFKQEFHEMLAEFENRKDTKYLFEFRE
ncbi:MAG: transposase [Bacteroidetes bacterium]|nr:transposase [Bacteroidota bacterium]